MNYSSSDYEFLGKQVAAGKYYSRTTCVLAILLALCMGGAIGRLTADTAGSTVQKRPLEKNAQGGMADAVNANKQSFDSIIRHEEEVRRDPKNTEAWIHLGNLYFDTKQPQKAINAYAKALEMDPKNPGVLVDSGVMYRELKQFPTALEYFQRALKVDSKHEFALFNSGIVLYFDMQRKEEGLAAWRELAKINPQAKAPDGTLVSTMLKDLADK